MNNQFFVAIGVAVVASVLMTGLASTINAQSNMTGANMTGANMTGANMTGANMTGANMSMPSGTTGDGGGGDDGDGDGGGDGDGRRRWRRWIELVRIQNKRGENTIIFYFIFF